MITIDGQVKRNACEQIEKNRQDVEELKGSITTPKFVNIQGDAMDNASLASKLNEKVDKETGKGLSTNDFTIPLKTKLEGIDMSTKQDKLSEDQMKAVNSGVTQETFDDVVEVANEVFNREYKLETDTPTKLTIVRDDVNKRTKLNITVEGGGGGEPASYIKNITQAGSTYTAYKKDDSSLSWTIPDVSSFTTKTYVDNQDNAISISLADEINERKAADEELEDSIEDLEAEMPNKLDKTAARIKTVAIDENKITFTKVDDTTQVYEPDIPQAMTYKGTRLQANLPTTGMQNGDYYKLSDTYPSQYYGQCAIWDSSKNAWDYSDSNVNLNNYYTKTEVNEGFATKAEVNAKQDTIADLATIRSGAALGATALQEVPNTYRTAAAQDVIDNGFEQAIRDEESEREAADSALQDNIDLKQDKLPEGEDGKYLKAELDPGSGAMALKWADVPAGPDTYIKTVNLGTANRIVFTKADDTTQQFDVDLSAYRTAANQNEIDATFVKLTGDQVITGVKKFGEIWAGETNEYTKLFKDCIQHEKNGTAYEYSYPNKNGTFAMTSDIPDVSTYLPLSGGTMTGAITMGANSIKFGTNNKEIKAAEDNIKSTGNLEVPGGSDFSVHADNYTTYLGLSGGDGTSAYNGCVLFLTGKDEVNWHGGFGIRTGNGNSAESITFSGHPNGELKWNKRRVETSTFNGGALSISAYGGATASITYQTRIEHEQYYEYIVEVLVSGGSRSSAGQNQLVNLNGFAGTGTSTHIPLACWIEGGMGTINGLAYGNQTLPGMDLYCSATTATNDIRFHCHIIRLK